MKQVSEIKETLRKGMVIGWQEFLMRDQGTFLGLFWTLINPLVTYVSFSRGALEISYTDIYWMLLNPLLCCIGLYVLSLRSKYIIEKLS